ncbi:MAG: hypothetical protein V1722_02855 [Candidatus Micrarchaeota archaeon]
MVLEFLPYLVLAGVALLFFSKVMPFLRPNEKDAEEHFDTSKSPF